MARVIGACSLSAYGVPVALERVQYARITAPTLALPTITRPSPLCSLPCLRPLSTNFTLEKDEQTSAEDAAATCKDDRALQARLRPGKGHGLSLESPAHSRVQDVAESLNISNLPDAVTSALASDVEYRIQQVVEVRAPILLLLRLPEHVRRRPRGSCATQNGPH